jgi:hypothetical protein
MWKSPLYIRLDRTTDGSGKMLIGQAGALPPAHIGSTLVVLKLDLELDETLFLPAFDTQVTVRVDRQALDVSKVVAGLKQIDKDVKDI